MNGWRACVRSSSGSSACRGTTVFGIDVNAVLADVTRAVFDTNREGLR